MQKRDLADLQSFLVVARERSSRRRRRSSAYRNPR